MTYNFVFVNIKCFHTAVGLDMMHSLCVLQKCFNTFCENFLLLHILKIYMFVQHFLVPIHQIVGIIMNIWNGIIRSTVRLHLMKFLPPSSEKCNCSLPTKPRWIM